MKDRHAQGEGQDVRPFDDQGFGPVGAGHQLAPEDRVRPGAAVDTRPSSDPSVGPPRDMEAGRCPSLVGRRFHDRG